ncbi:CDP-alcohol phosphatidyltransferase family protein [Patescibacteria group bacterium]|nr:CDP-alcohol phosphatidyltransferase family protein [Patescibacteria group bacterium]MBU4601080.1 CDP-alcohol phosphatidyltransferase family protein [Patescibacteria group bacterium]MCG2698185.1 CDP-alcohol phosphatidyltransferase family protein [Candidatus Parcubacteria bacterium]
MANTNFEPAEEIYWHDRILAKTVLKFFPKFIIPNHITVFRFLATPVVAALMFYEHYYIGLFAFLLVAFTDALDGSMARTRNQITEWGKIYDPLADKILIASMVFIIVLRYIDFWTAIIIIGLEIIIIFTAWVRKSNGKSVQANWWGKIKMCLQVLGVVILLLSIVFDWAALLPFASGVLYLAIAFAIVSLLTYGI